MSNDALDGPIGTVIAAIFISFAGYLIWEGVFYLANHIHLEWVK